MHPQPCLKPGNFFLNSAQDFLQSQHDHRPCICNFVHPSAKFLTVPPSTLTFLHYISESSRHGSRKQTLILTNFSDRLTHGTSHSKPSYLCFLNKSYKHTQPCLTSRRMFLILRARFLTIATTNPAHTSAILFTLSQKLLRFHP